MDPKIDIRRRGRTTVRLRIKAVMWSISFGGMLSILCPVPYTGPCISFGCGLSVLSVCLGLTSVSGVACIETHYSG